MKTFITALFLVFALASGTSMMALSGHGYARLAENSAHAARNHEAAIFY
jgi:hypothetical protein